MSERLEIDALRALLTIARSGGVSRAAEQLGLSQSAVSHKMRRLEQSLGSDLLARRAGGPLLTEAGERLLHYAQRMIDLHDEAIADLGRKQLAGAIRLAMTEDTATSDFARILGRFSRLYPEVSVHTRTGQSLNVQNWLKNGELDLAVIQVFAKDVQPDDLVLFEDTLHWVKSPGFEFDPSEPVRFLAFDQNCFYRQWGFGDGLAQGHRLKTVLECPSAAGIQSAVRSGLGVALLNGMHVTPDIEIVDGIFPEPPQLTFVARPHPGQRRSAQVKALTAEIRRELGGRMKLQLAG